MTKFVKNSLAIFAIAAITASITACDFGNNDRSSSADPGSALIANTDYTTGSVSSINMSDFTAVNDNLKGTVDSDLGIRSTGGRVYILNRTNGNIMRVDPANAWNVPVQKSTGTTSNPHDIVVKGSVAYISFYGRSSIWTADPDTLDKKNEIDLAAYTPSGVSTPSIDQMWLDSGTGYLYVSAQRLDSTYAVADYSDVIVIDTATNTVIKEINLKWTDGASTVSAKNPYSRFVYATKDAWNNGDGHDHLFILCTGTWSGYDGGIIAIDTADLSVETGYTVSENHLGMDIVDFDYNGKFYVATNGTSTSGVSSVISNDGTAASLLSVSTAYKVPFVRINQAGLLFAGDQISSGVWVFDTKNNDRKKYSSAISTGLPPSDITFME